MEEPWGQNTEYSKWNQETRKKKFLHLLEAVQNF